MKLEKLGPPKLFPTEILGMGFIVKVELYIVPVHVYGWGDRQGRVSVAVVQAV